VPYESSFITLFIFYGLIIEYSQDSLLLYLFFIDKKSGNIKTFSEAVQVLDDSSD
jgi:hypothetical protein